MRGKKKALKQRYEVGVPWGGEWELKSSEMLVMLVLFSQP